MTTLEERVSNLEGAYGQVDRRLGELNDSFRGVRSDFRSMGAKVDGMRDGMDARFDATDAKTDRLQIDMDAKFEAMDFED